MYCHRSKTEISKNEHVDKTTMTTLRFNYDRLNHISSHPQAECKISQKSADKFEKKVKT